MTLTQLSQKRERKTDRENVFIRNNQYTARPSLDYVRTVGTLAEVQLFDVVNADGRFTMDVGRRGRGNEDVLSPQPRLARVHQHLQTDARVNLDES